jgi:hypothetical protein
MSDNDKPRASFGRRVAPPRGANQPSNDRSANDSLRALLKTPRDRRNEAWGHAFLECVVEATFVESCEELTNAEGHRAYAVAVANGEAAALAFAAVVRKAVDAGRALVLFAGDDGQPDFVFTHGELSPYVASGALMPLHTKPVGSVGSSDAAPGAAYITSNPAAGVLPPATRAALRAWLAKHRGLTEVRICLRFDNVTSAETEKTLAIDAGSLPADDAALRELMRDIHWYLPPDIAVGVFSGMAKDRYFAL